MEKWWNVCRFSPQFNKPSDRSGPASVIPVLFRAEMIRNNQRLQTYCLHLYRKGEKRKKKVFQVLPFFFPFFSPIFSCLFTLFCFARLSLRVMFHVASPHPQMKGRSCKSLDKHRLVQTRKGSEIYVTHSCFPLPHFSTPLVKPS